MKSIKNYIWFVRVSQDFMKGHNPFLVFFKSLSLGFGFCKEMNKE